MEILGSGVLVNHTLGGAQEMLITAETQLMGICQETNL